MNLKHGSLFSGIGGFDLAATWTGWENMFHCEWNEFGQSVLRHHDPKSKTYNDITKTDFTIWRGRIDILTGGFPCQPYSSAGKRKGKDDERHLWPEMLRAIREIAPRWVVGENVFGLTNWNGGLVFEEVQADLENEGYEVQAYILPAAGVDAPHQRYRVWFVAYSDKHYDGRGPEGHESKSREERVQKWQSVREPSQSGSLRRSAPNASSIRRNHRRNNRKERHLQGNFYGYASKDKSERNRWRHRTWKDGGVRSTPNASSIRRGAREERKHNGACKRQICENFTINRDKVRSKPWNGSGNRITSYAKRSRFKGELLSRQRQGKFGRCDLSAFTYANSRRQPTEEHRQAQSRRVAKEGFSDYWQNFPTQSPIRTGDDGFQTQSLRQRIREDCLGVISEEEIDEIFSKAANAWTKETIKAGGNAVVPPLVSNIFNAINKFEKLTRPIGHNL